MKLLVGQIDKQLTDLIKSDYPNAVLITEENQFDKVDIGYTGIEEFNDKESFLSLLLSAESIFYYPWTDSGFNLLDPTQSGQGLTEYFLFLAQQEGIEINNFSFLGSTTVDAENKEFLKLVDYRKLHFGPQLWCAGCSFTVGVGVDESSRYATLLSKKLKLPLNLLAMSGTSVEWAADQILRSDIQKGDIVVWGLTSKNRFTYIKNGTVTPFNIITKITNPIEKSLSTLLTDDTLMSYYELTAINQVTNFCNKIEAKLLIVGLLSSPQDLLYLQHLNNYYHYHYHYGYLDLGTDNMHPGPKQHLEFSNKILTVLKNKDYV